MGECKGIMIDTIVLFLLRLRIQALYGSKCPDYARGCPCCDAWSEYYRMAILLKLIE